MTATVVPTLPSEYAGREQAYIKHLFLRQYLGRLVHKIGSFADHIVYVDGFSGPWKSAAENYTDTSFGIALKALSDAQNSWANMSGGRARMVRMSAHLVETDPVAFAQLQTIGSHFPAVDVTPYPRDFMEVAGEIAASIPQNAFSFVLVDPKGFALDMAKLRPLIAKDQSEVVFNFMYDFANRFPTLPQLQSTFDRVFVGVDWRAEYDRLAGDPATSPEDRKKAFLRWFKQAVRNVGGFKYVADVEIKYPGTSRTFYYLVYGTRKPAGIKVFRDCQIKALEEQTTVGSKMRSREAEAIGQGMLFDSMAHGPDPQFKASLEAEAKAARKTMIAMVPAGNAGIPWQLLWPAVLADHVIGVSALGRLANELRKDAILAIPSWSSAQKQIPDDSYRLFRGQNYPVA